MIASMRTTAMLAVWAAACVSIVSAQQRRGDVTGTLQYLGTMYSGDFVQNGLDGGVSLSLGYGLSNRMWVEARAGAGTYSWQTNQAMLSRYDDYFGRNAAYGALYPGSRARIESTNESSFRLLDVLMGYTITASSGATPFVTAGLGMLQFQPRTSTLGDALPNYANGVYASTAVSIPLGAGVRYPLSDVLSMSLRAEYRIVFSGYLDDYAVQGFNDGLYAVSAGVSYTFAGPSTSTKAAPSPVCPECSVRYDSTDCTECAARLCAICRVKGPLQHPENHEVGAQAPPRAVPAAPAEAETVPAAPVDGMPDVDKAPEPEAMIPDTIIPRSSRASAPPSAKRRLTVNGIRFGVNSEQINFEDPATRTNLNEILEYLRESCQELRVMIEGHASSDGPAERNQELSVLRAQQVASWLVEQGVPQGRIQGAVGYGATMPKIAEPSPAVASRMTKEQLEAIREQNRRIELTVLEDCK